jgi:peptidoglycan hydrolase-like protein with peptidoglycan-binding domain
MPSTLPVLRSSQTCCETFSPLRHGACGPEVEYLQGQLLAAGFDPGPIDGIFGPKTKAAVMAFQRAKGLEVNGVANPRTWAALDTLRGQGLRPILKRGLSEPAVEVLQKLLISHGFDAGPVDGIFSPRTERAVMAFQRAKGLEADGIAGPKTWSALGTAAPRSLPEKATEAVGVLLSTTLPDSGWSYSV